MKQQRQGSPHTACRYWQFGSLSAAGVICHCSKSQPCSGNGCQTHPLVGTEHRTASPTPCALECARAHSAPGAVTALGRPSGAPRGLKIPSTKHLHSRYLQRCKGEQRIAADLHFQLFLSRAFLPPTQLRLGAEGVGQTLFPARQGLGDHTELRHRRC